MKSFCFPVLFQIRFAVKQQNYCGNAEFLRFFERPDKILYDSSSCAVPETVQKLKAEVIVEDLALYPPETYNHFTFDKFLAFPSADSDMETFRKFADEHFSVFHT